MSERNCTSSTSTTRRCNQRGCTHDACADHAGARACKETIEKRKKKGKSRDEPEDDDDFSDTLYLELRTENLTRIDPFTGTYVFDVEDYNTKFRVVFTEVVKGRPNYQIGASDF